MALDFGIFDHVDRSDLPLTDFYEQRLKLIEGYDRAGFRTYHCAEHHSTPLGMSPSPSLYLSAVAQRTKRLRFGPLVGGLTVAVASWPWVFLVHVALALLTLALARTGVVESADPHAVRIDLPGMATLSLAVFCLVFLITRGQRVDAGNPVGLALAGVGIASLLAFIAVETRTARPMFDFAAFRARAFSGALLGSAGMNFSFWPFMIYLPIWFQVALGYDSVTAGLALLAFLDSSFLSFPEVTDALIVVLAPSEVLIW